MRLAVTLALVFIATPAVARHKCVEQSDVVGYETCNRFGDGWALEKRLPFTLSFDARYSSFDPNGLGFTMKNDAASVNGSQLGVPWLDTWGFGLRMTGFFAGPFYTGIDFAVTAGQNDVRVIRVPDSPNTFAMDATALVGVRVPLWRFAFRADSAFGGAFMTFGNGDSEWVAARGLVRMRGTLETWLSPNVSVDAFAGFDMVDARQRILGIALTFHARSYDGLYALF